MDKNQRQWGEGGRKTARSGRDGEPEVKIIKKRLSHLSVLCLVMLSLHLPVYSAGLACPEGQIDSAGTPTLSDIFEFIDKNPDKAIELFSDTRQWPHLTLAAGIIAGRDAVMAGGGRPIPAHLRKTLRRWYSDDLLNAVRWTTIGMPMQRLLQDARMVFGEDTLAMTLMDAVIFRSEDLPNDGSLWAHELYHAQQYREWGVFGFAKKWVDNPSVNGPVEAPAYAREAEARPFFLHRDD